MANGLVAELIVENGTVCPEQFGAKGDGVTDDTCSINNAFSSGVNVVFGKKTYGITSSITLNTSSCVAKLISKSN